MSNMEVMKKNENTKVRMLVNVFPSPKPVYSSRYVSRWRKRGLLSPCEQTAVKGTEYSLKDINGRKYIVFPNGYKLKVYPYQYEIIKSEL